MPSLITLAKAGWVRPPAGILRRIAALQAQVLLQIGGCQQTVNDKERSARLTGSLQVNRLMACQRRCAHEDLQRWLLAWALIKELAWHNNPRPRPRTKPI
jgi:hypothetical protein